MASNRQVFVVNEQGTVLHLLLRRQSIRR